VGPENILEVLRTRKYTRGVTDPKIIPEVYTDPKIYRMCSGTRKYT
jgi:hypothetical protein